MAIEVLMPALSPTMKEGNLARWIKKEGDVLSSGDIIAEIETDKATMEIEATDSGTLGKILIAEGTNDVKVNTLIAIILEKGESADAINSIISKPSSPIINESTTKSTQEVQKITSNTTSVLENNNARVFASPLAKRIAEEKNINLSNIAGSGPNSRVIKKDVEAYNPQITTETKEKSYVIPHSNMRRVIARRLLESKQTVPHFYVSIEASVSKLNEARKDMNTYLEKFGEKISVNDIIIKACGNALRQHPNVNASWSEEGMIFYNSIDISVAVGIQDGLITPIIKNADTKSLRAISKEAKDLIKRAKENKLSLEEFQGGGFSISNLGMYNISQFGAIINPPQSAIIAIGGVKMLPKLCKKTNTIFEDEIINLTLSCDHRVIDGVLAAEFLNTVKLFIENPSILVL